MLLPRSHFPRLGMDGDHGVRSFFLSGGPSVTNWSQNPLLATCSVEGLGLVGVRGGLRVWKLGPQAFLSHVLNLDPPPLPLLLVLPTLRSFASLDTAAHRVLVPFLQLPTHVALGGREAVVGAAVAVNGGVQCPWRGCMSVGWCE